MGRKSRTEKRLARLIAEQARDARRRREPRRHGEVPAEDLGFDLDSIAAAPAPRQWPVYLEGSGPWDWSGLEHLLARAGEGPCPICEDKPLRRGWYCLGCDRVGHEAAFRLDGEPVDSRPDWDWRRDHPEESATRYEPGAYRGGTGR